MRLSEIEVASFRAGIAVLSQPVQGIIKSGDWRVEMDTSRLFVENLL